MSEYLRTFSAKLYDVEMANPGASHVHRVPLSAGSRRRLRLVARAPG